MIAGVSTACLYPQPLEESLYNLAVNGVSCAEIFINSHSELKKSFSHNIAEMLRRFDMKCVSVHPFTCEIETMMFFSDYERRIDDILEYYKLYFDFMNAVGAEIFVFHGGKTGSGKNRDFYCERYSRLWRLGREFGVKTAIENVSRCQSASSSFIREISNMLGNEFAFVLDTKQAVRAGENPFNFVDAVGKNLAHVHISDSGEYGDCLPIGKGRFKFKNFFEKINSYNPECSVVLELYRSGFGGIGELISNYNVLENMLEIYGRGEAK